MAIRTLRTMRAALLATACVEFSSASAVYAQTSPQTAPVPTPGQAPPTQAPESPAEPESAAESAVDDIIVTGFRASLQKALDLKRDAIGVRDSIVAEDIGKFPEANIAEALQRVPGVLLQRDGNTNEGNRIAVRGLPSEFTVTTINGAPVRATSAGFIGGATRDFNYDLFPSELFSRVDFYKTPLAHLEEGGIGGVVDLRTPRPFDNPGTQASYALGLNYARQSREANPRGSALASTTSGRFGALVGVAYSKSLLQRTGFNSTGHFASEIQENNPDTRLRPFGSSNALPTRLDFRGTGANLGGLTQLQVQNALLPRFIQIVVGELQRERVGINTSFQYKDDRLDISIDSLFSSLTDINIGTTPSLAIRATSTARNAAGAVTSTNAPGVGTNSGLIPLDVRIDANGILVGTFGNGTFGGTTSFNRQKAVFEQHGFSGEYKVTDDFDITAYAGASKSQGDNRGFNANSQINNTTVTYDFNDYVYPTLRPGNDPLVAASYNTFGNLSSTFAQEVDLERVYKLTGDYDYKLFGVDGHLKAGGSLVRTTKRRTDINGNAAIARFVTASGKSYAQMTLAERQALLSPIEIGGIAPGQNPGFPRDFLAISRSTLVNTFNPEQALRDSAPNLNNTFKVVETIKTGFIQSDFSGQVFGQTLRVNGGLRFSETEVDIDNFLRSPTNVFTPAQSTSKYRNWLPSVSAAYDLQNDLVLRASYGKTITRSSLGQIAQNIALTNPTELTVTVGNPNLKPQTSSSYDAGLEWYFNQGGLLSAGVFRRNIKDAPVALITQVPFEDTGIPLSFINQNLIDPATGRVQAGRNAIVSTFVNQRAFKLEGIEVAYQQNFRFLPAPFDGLGAIASYTYVKSAGIRYELITGNVIDPASGLVTQTGSTRGEVFEISPFPEHTYNITGYYEKGPFAVRATYNYRSDAALNFIGISGSANPGQNLIRKDRALGFLDASISYRFSDLVELRLTGQNLTNQTNGRYLPSADGSIGGDPYSRTESAIRVGPTYSVGIRGKF